MLGSGKMSLKQMACFAGRGLFVCLALSFIEGKDSSCPPGTTHSNAKAKPAEADGRIDNTDLALACGPRKVTKRSRPSDASWLRNLAADDNCQIIPITPVPPRDVISTRRPCIAAPSPKKCLRFLHFIPYYGQRRRAFHNVLFPANRVANGYNANWPDKSSEEDSSEEKRRKRDTLAIVQKRSRLFLKK